MLVTRNTSITMLRAYRPTANGHTSASSVRCALQTPSILFSSSLSSPKIKWRPTGVRDVSRKGRGHLAVGRYPGERCLAFNSRFFLPLRWEGSLHLSCRRAFTTYSEAALRTGPPSLLAWTNFFFVLEGSFYHVHEKMVGKH